jgi:hypothetical protein
MEFVAAVASEGTEQHVLADEGGVAIVDARLLDGDGFADGHVLPLSEAQKLHDALGATMQPGAPSGVIAQVETAAGTVYVKRSSAAVSLTRDLREHANVNLRLLDQVEAMHAALGQAIDTPAPVSDAPQEQSPADDGETAPRASSLPEPVGAVE